MDVALARCHTLPEEDPDEAPALAALRAEGLTAESLSWDEPGADFSAARLTILRATWNYSERAADFLAWAERTAAVSRLWNPIEVVRWNLHKRYLLDLERRGVPVVPTHVAWQGSGQRLLEIAAARGWDDLVVKPAISAGSRETLRLQPCVHEQGERHLARLLESGDVLVQPYLSSVEGYGERAIVWIDGEVTHAVRKSPRFLGMPQRTSQALPVADDERELAIRAVAAVGHPLLYARIDLARLPSGEPVLMELEVLEPSLFFPECPEALARLVAGVKRRLAEAG